MFFQFNVSSMQCKIYNNVNYSINIVTMFQASSSQSAVRRKHIYIHRLSTFLDVCPRLILYQVKMTMIYTFSFCTQKSTLTYFVYKHNKVCERLVYYKAPSVNKLVKSQTNKSTRKIGKQSNAIYRKDLQKSFHFNFRPSFIQNLKSK